MKRRMFIAALICLTLVLLTACENSEMKNDGIVSSDVSSESVTEQQSVSEEMQSADGNLSDTDSAEQFQTEEETRKAYVIVSFQAVEGAAIYDIEYDSNTRLPVSCRFHKKCESCGYVSNSNGQARGNFTTSYHCDKCGNNQHVEITASFDWVDVRD